MTRFAALLVVMIAVVASPASAQKTPAADPSKVAAAKDLMRALGAQSQFKLVVDTMTKGMSGVVKQRQPGHDKDVDEVFGLLRDKFNSRSSEVLDMVAPLWADKFTMEEIGQIAAFYKTPIGAKLIATQPEIMQKSMQLGMAWGQRIGQEVEAEAKLELKKRGIDL